MNSNQHVIVVVPIQDGMLWGQDMKAGHIYTIVGNYNLALIGDINALAPIINGGYSGDGVEAAVDQYKWGIDIQASYIYTIAGDTALATNNYVPLENRYGGDDGFAVGAKLADPFGVALDAAGNLYIADAYNHLVRIVSASDQVLWGQTMQAKKIYTVAGNYTLGNNLGGFSGDGGPANQAKLNKPWTVTVDSSGNLYIADGKLVELGYWRRRTGCSSTA